MTPAACGLAGTTVTCALGDLAKGQSVSIALVAGDPGRRREGHEDERGDRHLADARTPNLANNRDDATVTITAPPPSQLQVRKTASPSSVAPGGTVVFSLTLTVPSDIDAKGVDLCDTLPAELVFVSRAGCDVQQGPRVLAPGRRQGAFDDDLHDHGQGGRRRDAGHRHERRAGPRRQRAGELRPGARDGDCGHGVKGVTSRVTG